MRSSLAPPGWFSKRHQTNEALLAYKAAKEARAQEQYAACQARIAEAAKRTPQEQLSRLNKLFGPGKGAQRERAKIALKIKAQKEADKAKAQQEAKKDSSSKKSTPPKTKKKNKTSKKKGS